MTSLTDGGRNAIELQPYVLRTGVIKEGRTFDKIRANHGLVEIINCSNIFPLIEFNLKKAEIILKKIINIIIINIVIHV